MATKFQEIAGHLNYVVQNFSKTILLAGQKCAVPRALCCAVPMAVPTTKSVVFLVPEKSSLA
jgi:hypothetical protein